MTPKAKRQVWTRLQENVLSERSSAAIYKGLISLNEPCHKAKKHASLMPLPFNDILHAEQFMIRHPRGQNNISKRVHSPLTIPRVPVTLANIKWGRSLAKISSACKTPLKVLTKKSIQRSSSRDWLPWGKLDDLSWTIGKIYFTRSGVKMRYHNPPNAPRFLTHPVCY